jgi:prepilin-type N-terminal cleavage/methylation domain-containing protein
MHVRTFRHGFTLIELLVVIAIIAILAVVVILTLNPAQLLAQSRDANRVADMATLNTALNLYTVDAGGTGFMGTSSIVYTSLSDASSTCSHQSLPALPSGYTYNCTVSTSTRNTNTTGWIPLNFQTISEGAPFGSLPIDPTNTSSSRLYYTYDTNGSQYETTASMESSKYKLGGSNDVISSDGGLLASVYEKGTQLGLEPLDYGDTSLVGYWPMNEGAGSTSGVSQTVDASGNGNNGTWYGTAGGTNGTYYAPGKVGNWAGTFDGSTDYITVGTSTVLQPTNAITISAWVNTTSSSTTERIISNFHGTSYGYVFSVLSGLFTLQLGNGTAFTALQRFTVMPGIWYHVVATWDGANIKIYVNGTQQGAAMAFTGFAYDAGNVITTIGGNNTNSSNRWNGSSDDVRIYNRALSAAEIQAMYNAGK